MELQMAVQSGPNLVAMKAETMEDLTVEHLVVNLAAKMA